MSDETLEKPFEDMTYPAPSSPSIDLAEQPEQHQDHEREEVNNKVYLSIRGRVSSLPPKRYDEIFEDFAVALDRHDIDLLAKTIANWALGGNEGKRGSQPIAGYRPVVRKDDDDEMVALWNEMWSGASK